MSNKMNCHKLFVRRSIGPRTPFRNVLLTCALNQSQEARDRCLTHCHRENLYLDIMFPSRSALCFLLVLCGWIQILGHTLLIRLAMTGWTSITQGFLPYSWCNVKLCFVSQSNRQGVWSPCMLSFSCFNLYVCTSIAFSFSYQREWDDRFLTSSICLLLVPSLSLTNCIDLHPIAVSWILTVQEKIKAFREYLEPLRMTLGQQQFVGGDQPNYGDYSIASVILTGKAVSNFEVPLRSLANWLFQCRLLVNLPKPAAASRTIMPLCYPFWWATVLMGTTVTWGHSLVSYSPEGAQAFKARF